MQLIIAEDIGYDLGLLLGPLNGVWLGASGFDLSDTDIDWSNDSDNYPIRSRYMFGVAYAPEELNLILSGQYTLDPSGMDKICAGTEYGFSPVKDVTFALRGGLTLPRNGEALFSAGAGLKILESLTADVAWIQNRRFVAENTSDTLVFGAEFIF